uniref:Deleted in malignant brain tumors 1 protein n=1 Tax=Amphimedon queenslandica TaxID=400682 RepID=A0A1X7U110_AMPQE
ANSFRGQWFNRKYPFKFYNIKCYGNESNLHECDYDTQGVCSIYHTLGVSCQQANCTDGDIKLLNEVSDNHGIVLICKNGAWTRVCTDNKYYWSISNTDVVCRQLGYTVYGNTNRQVSYQQAYPTAFFRFNCRGSETNFSSCSSYLYFSMPQYCHRTIEITCAEPCTTGDTQLIGSHYYGRVEVCLGGVWGTICRDSFWDNTDASVVCKQLGFSPYGAIAVPINWYSISTKFNFAGGVSCSGNETQIFKCPFNSSLSCPPSNDANVICPVHSSTYSNCTDGDIKLLNGSTEYEGRVEICINKAWGTITYFYGTSNEAQTVCNQLGYTAPGARRLNNAYFGEGSSPVLVTYVHCSTPRNSLMNCSLQHTWRVNYRGRNHVIGVRCQTYCQHGSIRLTGFDPLQGCVEVCVNGTWGSVCNDYWHNSDARVVCRQLGFPSEGAIARVTNYYGTSLSFHIIDLNCNGSEETVLDCSYNNVEQHSCQRYEDASVQCQIPNTTDNCTNGVIRLIRGEAKNEGLVEICADGSWGYVCPRYGWGQSEAMVTCRQLGYTAIGARTSSSFGKGAGPVHFSSFYCSGNENNLLDCSHYTSPCSYSYHAGVICQAPCNEGDVQLQGDRRYNSFGRVEVCNGDTWGTICDDYWDNSDASVICKQLGFSPYGAIAKTSFYSENHLPHIIFNMSCNGDEESIFNCSYSAEVPTGSNCHSTEDASVICQDIQVAHSNCVDYDVILVGGETGNEGKVLMCLNGAWGTLCDNGFNANDAAFGVVCNNAGYSKRGSRYSANFPNSSNEILLVADMYCSSTDERIEDCSVTHYTPPSTCDVLDIVAVRCHTCTDGDIRIIPYGSITSSVGRVEVCSDDSWGTICNDFFDHDDAQVICRQLGYSALGSVSVGPLNYNFDYYHIIDINCTGTESNIQDCPSNNLTTCPTNRDAGVSCNNISLTNYTNCTDGELRLAGGTELSGRVEICYNRIWYGICSDNYNRYSTPSTICKGLGHSTQGAVGSIVETYPPLPLLLFEFNCYGNRETLWDCYKSTIQCSNGPYKYAAVTCQAKCDDWEVRLYGSSYENIGAVEVCIDGEWSSVCYEDFDLSDAAAVCTQLGYIPYGNNESVDATCTDGSVRLVGGINELEGNVEICHNKFWGSVCHSGWNTIDANIACKQLGYQPLDLNRAGVICLDACDDGNLRLSGSNAEYAGRVEICIESIWTSLCDQNWDLRDAQVACRELGYSPYGAMPTYGCYTEGQLSFGITSINCTGSENALLNCSHSNPVLYNCRSHSDAGLYVKNINILSDVSVTLSDDYYGSTVGLLGQYNGKPEDDLLSRNENTTLPSNASTEEIHYEFGLTWILENPLESLFTYDDTGSWNTFYKPDYKPIFQPQFNDSALEEKAQEICGDDKLCLFDIAATGDVNIGQSTRETGQELTTITELLKPTCFCSEGYEGVMCNDTILQDCEEDFCLNGATCQIVAGAYLCICSDGFTGPNC